MKKLVIAILTVGAVSFFVPSVQAQLASSFAEEAAPTNANECVTYRRARVTYRRAYRRGARRAYYGGYYRPYYRPYTYGHARRVTRRVYRRAYRRGYY
jgi:hypothetical protein